MVRNYRQSSWWPRCQAPLEALDCHVGAKLKLPKTADRGAARARFFALAPHGDLTNGWTQLESSNLPCVGEIYETPLRAQSRTAAQWKFARCLSIAWVKDATIERTANQRGGESTYWCCGT